MQNITSIIIRWDNEGSIFELPVTFVKEKAGPYRTFWHCKVEPGANGLPDWVTQEFVVTHTTVYGNSTLRATATHGAWVSPESVSFADEVAKQVVLLEATEDNRN